MPELAFSFVIGFIVCLLLTAVFVFVRGKRRSSHAYLTLQKNLKQVDLEWNENSDGLVSSRNESDSVPLTCDRNYLLTGFLLSFLSWAGAVFLLILMISEIFLARSRMEKKLFASDLTKADLNVEKVKSLVAEILATRP